MAEITYDEWMTLTAKSWKRRSPELKRVDKAFEAYSKAKTSGVKTNALQELSRVFKLWVTAQQDKHDQGIHDSIRNRKKDEHGQGPAERLQSLIRGSQVSNVAIRRDLQAEVPDRLVMDVSLRNLKDSSKVREAYNRSNLAAHEGRDLLLKASTGGTPARTVYERWFGPYTVDRASVVRGNIKGLCDLFDIGVIIMKDARQLAGAWGDCFGFAMPGNKRNYVEFTLGRAFFLKKGWSVLPGANPAQRRAAVAQALTEAYSEMSDWTVGTMIHELGHATNNLPDVDFQAPNSYQVSPGGLTPDGWDQCSTPALDMALAIARPDLAVLNTDNYGQFCREALQATGK
jgi:hypothetical protein